MEIRHGWPAAKRATGQLPTITRHGARKAFANRRFTPAAPACSARSRPAANDPGGRLFMRLYLSALPRADIIQRIHDASRRQCTVNFQSMRGVPAVSNCEWEKEKTRDQRRTACRT